MRPIRKSELIAMIAMLPADSDISIRVDGSHLDIADLVPRSTDGLYALCSDGHEVQLPAPFTATTASKSLDLVGPFEIKTMLGVGRQRTYQLTCTDTFPAPVADLSAGKFWLAYEVREWIRLYRSHVAASRVQSIRPQLPS